eukprot:TRINITY_DN58213_c0_g1_i1.p1 TRINITY_DN58213_c0_g1~~TRINITY_DN58213_c0_g1_i1.p1  ORF type:complete len:425 (-),score=112.50 TRINITY_DN58213_c0_g1_i1:89-1363(-)
MASFPERPLRGTSSNVRVAKAARRCLVATLVAAAGVAAALACSGRAFVGSSAPLSRNLRAGRAALSGDFERRGDDERFSPAASADGSELDVRQVAGWFAAAAAAVLLSFGAVAPAFAQGEATGFAEFAKKGGKMDANPSCFLTDCGKQTKECFVEDGRCLKGALCLARCRGDPDCATQCFAEFGCPRLDAWLKCTVEDKQCVSVPEGTYDVKAFYNTDVPKKLRDFDVKKLEGKWYKVRGYNAKYDCYACQTNSFKYKPEEKALETEVKLRLERKKTGGYWENTLTEKMKVSEPDERSTLVAKGEIFGLSFQEEWYVLGGDDDFVVVAYTGNNLQDAYKGGYIYTRTPTLTPEVEKKARAVAEQNGFDWSKYCVIDNSCPAQPPVDYSKSVQLGLEDLPDLLEWFAPGSTRGGTIRDTSFNGEY